MRKLNLITGLFVFLFFAGISYGQNERLKIYNPEANAEKDIQEAVKAANENNKHVFLQIGGNWCGWCLEFHKFCEADEEISKIINENFEVVKVNYSGENTNMEIMEDLEFPNRFGFPVFIILDGDGRRIHTQNTVHLEDGKSSYVKEKVIRFFKYWTPAAINPETYKKN